MVSTTIVPLPVVTDGENRSLCVLRQLLLSYRAEIYTPPNSLLTARLRNAQSRTSRILLPPIRDTLNACPVVLSTKLSLPNERGGARVNPWNALVKQLHVPLYLPRKHAPLVSLHFP